MMRYFAEHMRNLNHISLTIESPDHETAILRTPPQDASEVLSASAKLGQTRSDELLLYIPTSDSTQVIQLPDKVEPLATEIDIKWTRLRLQLTSKTNSAEIFKTPRFVPPSFSDGEPLISPNSKVTWKPLPSDYWAELMDAWHCHKPHNDANHQHHSHKPDETLYSLALNGFHAQPGLAYYSDTHFLVHISDLSLNGRRLVHETDKDAPKSIKIWKWDLGIPVASVMRSMLREIVDAHAVYTIKINEMLTVWILNGHASCAISGLEPIRDGIKVLFTESSELADQRPDPELVTIPESAFAELKALLKQRNEHLPLKLRTMNAWKLSVI